MNNQQLIERFTALSELVSSVHDKCREGRNDVLELVDVFSAHNSLTRAFHEDCELYLTGEISPTTELMTLLQSISGTLLCGAVHIKENAQKLNTPIIDHFIHQMILPRQFPN